MERAAVGSYRRDADMDSTPRPLTGTTFLAFLLLTLLQASVQAQDGESVLHQILLWETCVLV